MKRIFMMLSVLSLVILLSGCFGSDEVDEALDIFCSDNPDALVCTNPEATRNEIVANMFNTMMIEFIEDSNENFCDDYFSATNSDLLDACKNDRFSLVPEDIVYLSDDVVITPGEGTNVYEVTTTYEDGSTGYTFTVKIVEEDGVIRFSEFSYEYNMSSDDDLYLSDDYIKEFMVKVINESDDGDSEYCSTYFTGEALVACTNDIEAIIPSIYAMYNPVIEKIGTNNYEYSVNSYDGLEAYTYTILFVEVGEEIYLSEIEYLDISTYNTKENAEDVLESFLYDFDNGDDLDYLCDEYIDGPSNIADCKTTFSGLYDNISTITNIEEDTTGVYLATVEFAGINTTTIVFELFIVVGDDGVYDMNLVVKSTDVLEPLTEYDADDVFDMLGDYVYNANLHETYDNETFCETYTAEPATHSAHIACTIERQTNKDNNVYIYPYYLSKDVENVNKYTIYVYAYTANQTMEYAYYVSIYEGSLGSLGFKIESKIERDVTASKSTITSQILDRYQDYAVDYLNTDLLNDTLFEDYLFARYNFAALGITRDEDISDISSITISNVVVGKLKDGYFQVTVHGLVDFVDPAAEDFVILQSGRIYFVMTRVMLFPLEVGEVTGPDIFEIAEAEAAYFVMDAYLNYYTGEINCNYFFAFNNSLTTSCETSPNDLFGDELVVSTKAVRTEGNKFVVTRYYYDDSNVLQSLPDLLVLINSYGGRLKFDEWSAVEAFTPEIANTLISDFVVDLLDPTIPNNTYCEMYGIDDDCDSVRADLLASTTTVTSTHKTVLIDGLEVEQVTINYTVDGVEQTLTYNLDFIVNDSGEYEVGDVEDALTEETMTLTEANTLIDQFIVDYNDSSTTNLQLEEEYFELTNMSPDFFIERTAYLDNLDSMAKVSLVEVTDELFYSFSYTIGTDSYTNTINIYKVVDGVYNIEFLDYSPAIPSGATLIESAFYNETIINMFISHFNNNLNDDAYMLDMYFNNEDYLLITNRQNILSTSTLTLNSFEIIKDGSNLYESIYVEFTYIMNGAIVVEQINYNIYELANGNFFFIELDKVVVTTQSVDDSKISFNNYLTDYLDSSISDYDLSMEWFGVPSHDALSGRLSFLVANGELEFVDVVVINNVYVASYTEAINGVTSLIEQSFLPIVDEAIVTFTFYEKVVSEILPYDASLTEANAIMEQYFIDLVDDTMTDLDFCGLYYDGLVDCVANRQATIDMYSSYLIDVSSVLDDNSDLIYEVVYQKNTPLQDSVVTTAMYIQIKNDNTYILTLDSTTTETQSLYYVPEIIFDEAEVVNMLQQLHEYYYDNTISSIDYCNNYTYTDNDASLLSWCISGRDEILSNNIYLEIQSIKFLEITYDVHGSNSYGFELVTVGTVGDSLTYDTFYYELMYLVVDDDALLGYLASYFPQYGNYTSVLYVDPTSVDTYITTQVAHYDNFSLTNIEVCNGYGITLPGDSCFVDRASINGFTLLSYSYEIMSSNSQEAIAVIELVYQNPSDASINIIKLPLLLEQTYEYGTGTISITDSDYHNFLTFDFTMEELELFAQSFVIDYFNSTLTNQYIVDTYQLGDNLGTEYDDYVRNPDLLNPVNPVYFDSQFSFFATTGDVYVQIFVYEGEGDSRTLRRAHFKYLGRNANGDIQFSQTYRFIY